MLTPEAQDALNAVALGDQYIKARSGQQRAGRTRSLQALLRRGLVTDNPHGYGLVVTDEGRKYLQNSIE